MMHVKKLRLLQRKGGDISKSKLLEKTRKYLDVIGTRIAELCADEADLPSREALQADLWEVRAGTTLPGICHEAHPLQCISDTLGGGNVPPV